MTPTDDDLLKMWGQRSGTPENEEIVSYAREVLALPVGPTDNTLLVTLIAVESAFAQKCADTWCTTSNLEVLEAARAVIAAAGEKVSRNLESER